MSPAAPPDEAGTGDSPFLRLLARWRRSAPTPDPAAANGAEAPLDSVTARQWLWGEGFVVPGGAEQVLALVEPLRLGPGMSVLDVSAGIGGAARMLAETFRIEASGLERDPELAEIGMALSAARRLARRAPVTLYDPESFDLPAARYDCVIAREATYALREKERFLRVLMQGLRPEGVLVATEFVLDPLAGDRGVLERLGAARRPQAAPLVARALRGLSQKPGIRNSRGRGHDGGPSRARPRRLDAAHAAARVAPDSAP